jgi:hypothetical protein
VFNQLYEHILKEESREEFEELFQPISSEEYEQRIIDHIREVCYQNSDGTWSSDKDVDLSEMSLERIPVEFKIVKGDFACNDNKLTSLEGAPKEVKGDFACNDNKLTSLEGAPKEVGGNFYCSYNKKSVEELKKTISRSYMDQIRETVVDEGRKEDLYKQFVETDKVPKEAFNFFVESDPTKKQKYLQWMLKQYTLFPERKTHIKDVMIQFDKLISKEKIKGGDSDIFQYDLETLDKKISEISKEKTKGEVKREEKSKATRIKETDRYLIVVPESYESSCYYGANTKWCISGRTASYWKEYWLRGVGIYIVIDKEKNKKYAVAVDPHTDKKEVYDEQDRQIGFNALVKKLGL